MELSLKPTKNLQTFSIFRIPPSLAYCPLHRSSRFVSRNFRVHCSSSSSNGFLPHENSVQPSPSLQILPSKVELLDPTSLGICPEPSDWPGRDEILRLTIEQKANNVGIPHSLRIIKGKRRSKFNGLVDDASEFADSSVRNAISSLVLIIREIQSFTLMLREGLSSEDLATAVSEIQQDMTLTFVRLFQHVFSKTPTLMVYVVLLLANFSAQSMADEASIGAFQQPATFITETESVLDKESEGEDQRTKMNGEIRLWKSMVEEASVELEPNNYEVHFRTDLAFQKCVAEEPDNAVLLANYALFLHLVVQDYDGAEELYRRAIEADPQDPEALVLFADFLWQVRKDDWEAEQTYLKALELDQNNPFHASKYANFLWSTGGQGTCLVFDAPK
ncbi:hypothetical protein GQ457_01G044290 [Hibiscus cannabinus]